MLNLLSILFNLTLLLLGLERVHLYLVDWGYNTEEQRQEVTHHTLIKLLTLSHNTLSYYT